MNTDDLTGRQLDVIKEEVRKAVNYLKRLGGRMRSRNFPDDDGLLAHTIEAIKATEALWWYIHKVQLEKIRRDKPYSGVVPAPACNAPRGGHTSEHGSPTP